MAVPRAEQTNGRVHLLLQQVGLPALGPLQAFPTVAGTKDLE